MALPKILRDFNLFGDGDNWQGQIAELTLPKLARVVEDYRGGGMDGTVEIDLGMEKLECEWTPGGLIEPIFTSFGSSRLDAAMLRFAGAYMRDDTEEVVPVEIVMRGRHREIDMGTAKNGDKNEQKVMTSLSYYKLTIAGKDIIEIDVPGYIFKVEGEDRLAEKRKALGI